MLAYFDCYSGISGDMTLGALVDLGVSPRDLEKSLKRNLRLRGFRLEARNVKQCGLRATRLRVIVEKKPARAGGADTPRRFPEIRQLVHASTLPERVKRKAIAAFLRLARAEAAVHRSTLNKIHFHELGSLDAIVDIAGSMLALDMLGIDEVYSSALPLGSGEIQCHHGTYPVPAPATLEVLRGVPVRLPAQAGPGDLAAPPARTGELVTPTGAAIITTIACQFDTPPLFRPTKIGYGAGSRTFPGRTNFLRVVLGEPLTPRDSAYPILRESLYLLSTEIDDMNPETYSYLLERLFEMGCLDVHLVPIQMKKNRPGVSLRILVPAARPETPTRSASPDTQEPLLNEIVAFILRETPTFGLKVQNVERYCLQRKIEKVRTKYGSILVKVGFWGDQFLKASPEYESCRSAALRHGVPFLEVYNAALAKIHTTYPPPARIKK
jgi:uncharacterized protein (TIGR00299 family) protein